VTHLGTIIENIDPMPVLQCLRQPPEVWREVEDICLELKHFTCKSVAGEAIHQSGWLQPKDFEHLLALDVPLTRAFAAVAIKRKIAARKVRP
jgi:hypothetical protein